MATDRRRRMVNTFDREPNKPLSAATVLAAVRREQGYGACKFGVARVLRARPNSRTFDAVERLLLQLKADGKVTVCARIDNTVYYEAKRSR